MSTLQYKAIGPERLDAMRGQGADEFGNPWRRRTAEGWEPLRCCLRTAREGEGIALISYSPWPLPWDTPWAEAGPVFVCHHRCAGYQTPQEYPPDLRGRFSLLSPFGHTGARAYRHITFVEPGDDPRKAVETVMGQPDVAYLHVRSATAQCFTFEVRPVQHPRQDHAHLTAPAGDPAVTAALAGHVREATGRHGTESLLRPASGAGPILRGRTPSAGRRGWSRARSGGSACCTCG